MIGWRAAIFPPGQLRPVGELPISTAGRRAALLGTTALVAASLVLGATDPAAAQSYIWGGSGSSTTTNNYNLGTNWATPPSGAPPVAAGQSAVFGNTGQGAVSVTAG